MTARGNMSRRIVACAVGFGGLALLAGCSVTSVEPAAEPVSPAPAAADAVPPHARSAAIFHLLAAEIAVQRGDHNRALEHYLEAMQHSGDARIAERAVRLAFLVDDDTKAHRAAERWLELAPGHPEVHQLLGVIALRAGDTDGAYRHLSAFLNHWHGDAEDAFSQIGLLLDHGVAGSGAVEVFKRLAADFADVPEAYLVLSRAALAEGRTGEALEAAERAVALAPGRRDAQVATVRALVQADRPGDAADRVEGMLAAGHGGWQLQRTLAHLLLQAGEDERALEAFRSVLREEPDDADALHAAAVLAEGLGEPGQAREWLERLVEIRDYENEARFRLGRLAEEDGDRESALAWYETVRGQLRGDAQLRIALLEAREGEVEAALDRLTALPADDAGFRARVAVIRGFVLRSERRYEEAVDAYSEGLESVPGDYDLLYGRALSRADLGDINGAVADLEEILKGTPDDAHALNALGYILADEGVRLEEAHELIRRALELQPDHPAILDSMGWVLFRQGRLEEARSYLERAFAAEPDAEIGAHLGEVLWELGDREAARRIWSEAEEHDPDHSVLRETLERLDP